MFHVPLMVSPFVNVLLVLFSCVIAPFMAVLLNAVLLVVIEPPALLLKTPLTLDKISCSLEPLFTSTEVLLVIVVLLMIRPPEPSARSVPLLVKELLDKVSELLC